MISVKLYESHTVDPMQVNTTLPLYIDGDGATLTACILPRLFTFPTDVLNRFEIFPLEILTGSPAHLIRLLTGYRITLALDHANCALGGSQSTGKLGAPV